VALPGFRGARLFSGGAKNSSNRWGRAADEIGVTAPRRIVPGETYFITRRCTQRTYLLRPDAETNAIFAYCLAEAAERHHIDLVGWNPMSNHHHAIAHDPEGRLPAFLEHFHKMMAKAMNARWGRAENFWSSEETCVTRLVTNHDILEKLVYVLCNPVAADLVDRVQDWPGLSSLAYMGKKETKHHRPKFYFRNADDSPMPKIVTLRAKVPSRITKHESAASFWDRVRKAVREREATLRERRMKEKRRVMGRKAVLRTPHTEAPKTEAVRGKLRPHIACKDKERRLLELEALKEFRAAYAAARVRLAAADRRATFPYGTYRLLALGVRCAPPPKLA
jgi:REP element-mobilizing transposase RayT